MRVLNKLYSSIYSKKFFSSKVKFFLYKSKVKSLPNFDKVVAVLACLHLEKLLIGEIVGWRNCRLEKLLIGEIVDWINFWLEKL